MKHYLEREIVFTIWLISRMKSLKMKSINPKVIGDP